MEFYGGSLISSAFRLSSLDQVARTELFSLYELLFAAYGPQGWWPAQDAFEIMVGAILTQATAWRNAAQAIARLRRSGSLDPVAMAQLAEAELAEYIRQAGFYRQKAHRLQGLLRLIERHGGVDNFLSLPTETLRKELLSVPGIGPETADSILLYAARRPAFVIDAYTRRILFRLGLIGREDVPYENLQRMFVESISPDPKLYGEYHALFVRHAKERCRKRPCCAGCPIAGRCLYFAVHSS